MPQFNDTFIADAVAAANIAYFSEHSAHDRAEYARKFRVALNVINDDADQQQRCYRSRALAYEARKAAK